ncbi:MAG: lipase maturation factor family protein [Bryobacteraceae bacterium]
MERRVYAGTSMADRPLLIFDGKCGFCGVWVDYSKTLTGDRVEYAPSQEAADRFPDIPKENFAKSVQLVEPGGEVLSGAHAVCRTLAYAPGKGFWLWAYEDLPGVAPIAEIAYRFIAAHRGLFYRLTRFSFGAKIRPLEYQFTQWLFLRLLSLIYLIAFLSMETQITGLIGSNGILPIGRFLAAVRQYYGASAWWMAPTVFWWGSSDAVLRAICSAGMIAAALAFLGLVPRVMLAIAYALYVSICSGGQDFMSFQWDMLLLEAGFLALFLGRSNTVVWLFRWLVFRLMFLSGSAKLLSHDRTWRNLTALTYHYWTQPLPTSVAWYMSQLPLTFQKMSTICTFAVELVIPFLLFAPRLIRHFAAFCIIGFQALIALTGNYTFFNFLTMALCLFAFDDASLRHIWPSRLTPKFRVRGPASWRVRRSIAILAVILVALGVFHFVIAFGGALPGPGLAALRVTSPLGIVNSYGLFAVMTTSRPEIVMQGSNDGSTWKDYAFRYKPGDVKRAPGWNQPFQPRLDWQMWFAALSNYQSSPWFVNFAVRLLQGSQPVLALLQTNPFPDSPPKYVRALVYDYHFTDFATRRATGAWWRRDYAGPYLPAISLNDIR